MTYNAILAPSDPARPNPTRLEMLLEPDHIPTPKILKSRLYCIFMCFFVFFTQLCQTQPGSKYHLSLITSLHHFNIKILFDFLSFACGIECIFAFFLCLFAITFEKANRRKLVVCLFCLVPLFCIRCQNVFRLTF